MHRKIAIFIFCLLVSGTVVLAQNDGGELQPNEVVRGEIAEKGEQITYTYVGSSTERIIITMTAVDASSLDTLLELYDPFGTLIAKNDDVSQMDGNSNSRIIVVLPFNGEYQVVARAFADQTVGAYEIFVSTSSDTSVAPPGDQFITLGDEVTGTLREGSSSTWRFVPDSDLNIQISLTSTDFDPLLEVYDADGLYLAGDDDSGADVNSFIYSLPVTAGAAYDIVARSFSDVGAGEYTLSISQAAPAPETQPISYGVETEGDVFPGQLTPFAFEATAGDVISIATFGDFDGYLELRDPEGILIAEDDDSGGDFMPRLTNIELTETGTYTVSIRGYDSATSGTFTITITEGMISAVQQGEITYGDAANGFLPQGDGATYVFSASAGDVVTIAVDAEMDTIVELYDVDENLLQEDDDSGGNLNPLIENYVIPTDGQYLIKLRAFSSEVSGNYHITLSTGDASSVVPAQSISYGDSVEGYLGAGERLRFNFDGQADDLISVTVVSEFDAKLEIFDSAGRNVTSDDDSGGDLQPAVTDFPLPTADTYTIIVTGYDDFEEGDFTITLASDGGGGVVVTPVEGEANIAYGDRLEADLQAGDDARYTFEASAGDTVTIHATSDDFDGYLDVYNAAGVSVAFDDDSGGGFNPLIETTLDEAGFYTIVLSSFGGQGSGAYTLSLELGEGTSVESTTPEASTSALTVGEQVTAMLEIGQSQPFTFDGLAGDVISISAAPTDSESSLDLYLEVYAPDASQLAVDDDSGWRLNPAITGLALPQDGTYRVELRSFAGDAAGEFTLAVASGSVYLAPNGATAQALSIGTAFEVTSAAPLYHIDLVTGDTLTLDSNLAYEVYSPSVFNFEEIENGIVAGEDGTYLVLFFVEDGAIGNVTASLGAAVTVEPFTSTAGAVLPDEPVSGTLQAGETQQWSFIPPLPGQYSFVLSVAEAETTYDPLIRLLDGAGTILAEDDDSGGNFNALLESVTIGGTQPLTIEVTSFANQVGGAYSLVVVTESQMEVSDIEGGDVTIGEGSTTTLELPGQAAHFRLVVDAENTYSLAVEGLTLPVIDLIDANGQLVARGNAALDNQKLPAGTYTVTVYDRLNQTGEFTLTITESE